MLTTSIIRKIDNLGRIVLPKELRKSLKIYPDDDLEIFVDNGTIILKKCVKCGNIKESLLTVINNLNSYFNVDIDIIDSNISLFDNNVDNKTIKIINDRKIVKENNYMNQNNRIIYPVIDSGELICSIIIVSSKSADLLENICYIISCFIKNNLI